MTIIIILLIGSIFLTSAIIYYLLGEFITRLEKKYCRPDIRGEIRWVN